MLIKGEKRYYLLFENWMVLFHLKVNSHNRRMLCTKFGSWGEDENVKSLHTDGQTDGRRTTGELKTKYLKQNSSRNDVCDVINVYISNQTSQSMWILEYCIFFINKRTNLFLRHDVVKYCWSIHALLNQFAKVWNE